MKEQPKGDRFSIYGKCTLLITALVGEDGQPLFTEADLPALMEKGATAIDRLFDIAARMSAIDVGDGRPSYLQTLFPDKLIRALVDRGDSDAEILAAIDSDELKWWFDRLTSPPAKCRALLAELRQRPSSGEGKPGPQPMVTAGDVARTRQELASWGRPAGERSIADELGVSRDAVRYALGKDRRRRRDA
ncbi:MAG: hypothetical protein IVW53_01285 [Chloroflexi bacterium]|nr:hypothetical protein [Chloroflexota bacterium]